MLSPERSFATSNGLFATMIARLGWLSFGGALAGGLTAAVSNWRSAELPKFYLAFQDAPALLLLGVFCLAAVRLLKTEPKPFHAGSMERLEGWGPIWIVAGLGACTVYAGAHLVYRHFALSLDEFMAEFDARIIASGRLLAPVAAEWRDYVPALQPIFRLGVPENAYWTSSYLPVNAAFRAVFWLIGDTALAGAALAGIALLALFGVARRLWLFLRDTRLSHALAAGVGFAACGLHQVIFHPLFAGPFLLSVLLSRRWKLAAFYATAYAAIGLFWMLYWSLLLHGVAEPAAQSADLGLAYQLRRVADMAQLNIFSSIALMGLNLFRFVAWQAPLTIPLALIGFVAFWRQSTVVRDLALGIALTLAVTMILMPYQGHGWGYRYLHGLLGSLSLLAAQGWIYLSNRRALGQQAKLLLASLLVSLLIILPWYAYQARSLVSPYASAVNALGRSDAQVVLVDPVDIWFGMDLVRNDPFLRTSPKVMALGHLTETQLSKLCRDYDVALFDHRDAAQFGLMQEQTEILSPFAQRHRKLRQFMDGLKCGRPVFGPR